MTSQVAQDPKQEVDRSLKASVYRHRFFSSVGLKRGIRSKRERCARDPEWPVGEMRLGAITLRTLTQLGFICPLAVKLTVDR